VDVLSLAYFDPDRLLPIDSLDSSSARGSDESSTSGTCFAKIRILNRLADKNKLLRLIIRPSLYVEFSSDKFNSH